MTTSIAVPSARRVARRGISVAPGWVAASLALFIALWFGASALAGPDLLPNPVVVAETFFGMFVEPLAGLTLGGHVLSSLSRWGTGFLIAALIGIPLGVAFGAIPVVRESLTPIFEFLRYIPPFAWIPLAILWMGAGQTSAAFIVFVAAFPAIVISTQVGIVNVDPRLKRAAVNLGSGRLRTIGEILTPVAVPSIFTGIRVAMSNGWMAVVAAEMIGGTQGVGFLIIQGQENGDVSVVISGMIAIGLTGALIDWIVNIVSRRATPWRKTDDARR